MRLSTGLKSAAVLAGALAVAPSTALAANTSLPPTSSDSFPAWQSTMTYEVTDAGTTQMFGNFARINSTVQYDATTNSYTIRSTASPTSTSTFGPGDIVSSNATFTKYEKTSGGTTEVLRMLNPGAGNPLIALTYTSFGEWKQIAPGAGFGGATKTTDTWFVYGIKTASVNMPHVGAATYNTVIAGTFVNKDGIYGLGGTGSITASFSSGTIGFSASPTAVGSAPALSFGAPITGTGTIAFGSSSFRANGSNGTYAMDMNGYFYGPSANEVGANFRLNGNRGSGEGVMVGH